MSDSIIVALITGVCAVAGNWLISRKGRIDDRVDRAKRDQYLDDQLKSINRKLDEHNGYAQKYMDITGDIRVIRNEIEHLKEA